MDTRGKIEELTSTFARAVSERDFATIGTFYEENARWLPPGKSMAEGREAILAAQKRMIEGGIQRLELETVDVLEAGDFAVEIGRITVTLKIFGIFSFTRHGKSVVVWRKLKDGSLKIVADIFNTN